MSGRGLYAQGRDESGQPFFRVEPEAVREQVERVASDPLFRNSKRYSGLLRFIADRSLDGRTADLKERIIGIEVFGRSPDYDTSLDATVRVTANEVRKRLALYYKESGHEQELRIDVPSGSYVAEFWLPEQIPIAQQTPQTSHSRQIRTPQETAALEPEIRKPWSFGSAIAVLKGRKLWSLGSAVAVVILALAAWALPRALSARPVIDQFWAPVLTGKNPVVLYLSSPSSPTPNSPPSFPSPSVDSGERFHEFIRKSRGQLPVADVNGASALSSFLQRKGKESLIRPANGASLSDLRSAPAVLLGSYYNDWVIRLGGNLHFRFRRESELGLRWIEDSANPQSRNWAMDLSAPYGQVNEDYALISRVLDPSTGRWLITIGGLTGSATTAACEIVADPNAMASLGAHLPKNWASKNLQVVLAVKLVQGSPGASQVIATYSW
jgi:hypothetical protein